MVKIAETPFLRNNYTFSDIAFGVILSIVILITSSYGFYLGSKGKQSRDIMWHLPSVKFLATYWGLNIFRLLFILPSLFVDIARVFGVLIWYNQISYIVQQYLILIISLCCVITLFQSKFILPTLMKNYNIAFVVFLVFLNIFGGCYIVLTDILEIEIAWIISNYSLLAINVAAFIASICVLTAFYFWHQKEHLAEKCCRISYAAVPFILSLCFIVKHVIVIFSKGIMQSNGIHSHFSIMFEILTLSSSFGIFLFIRHQHSALNLNTNSLSLKSPISPLMN